MGELYNPYPRLPKNIRQVGERDPNVKLYMEDYVNTYLKRLYPSGGRALRAGLLLGEVRSQDGTPYLFVDGALEMEDVVKAGDQVEFTEAVWNQAYQTMDQMFPKRSVLGWFLCGPPDRPLSPLNYWKQHGQYFSSKNQLMYLSCGLEGEEAVYVAAEDGFYRMRGYCIYYERNQMMQDYMVSRKDARRVEPGARDGIIRDFRQRMEDNREEARRQTGTLSGLRTACGVLTVAVMACGVVLFNNYQKMRQMEAVIASALPEDTARRWSELLGKENEAEDDGGEIVFEEIPGEIAPTRPEIVIEPESEAETEAEEAAAVGLENEAGTEARRTEAEAGAEVDSGTGAGTETGEKPETGAGAETEAEPETETEPVQVPADAVLYTVQEGETLYGICLRRYQSVNWLDKICQWNQLGNGDSIEAGQSLYLPPAEGESEG